MAGKNKKIGGGGLHHVAIVAKDFDGSVKFYKALGFVPVVRWGKGKERAVMLDTGDGSILEIFDGGKGVKPQGGFVHIALNSSDVDAAVKVAIKAGAKIFMEPKDMVLPYKPPMKSRFAFCTGPEGEVIEFLCLTKLRR